MNIVNHVMHRSALLSPRSFLVSSFHLFTNDSIERSLTQDERVQVCSYMMSHGHGGWDREEKEEVYDEKNAFEEEEDRRKRELLTTSNSFSSTAIFHVYLTPISTIAQQLYQHVCYLYITYMSSICYLYFICICIFHITMMN